MGDIQRYLPNKPEAAYYWLILILLLLFHLYCVSLGWNNLIINKHGFRQTQTALSAYYAAEEGFRIDYITPVLGPPWSIPMEFPVYQWAVALFSKAFNHDLVQSGRLISLVFFYMSLIAVYGMCRLFLKDEIYPLIVISLILCHPIYIFWSRTFMIESTVLFFSSAYLFTFMMACERKKQGLIYVSACLGLLGAMIKVTTFFIFLCGAGMAFFYYSYGETKERNGKVPVGKMLANAFFIGVIPVLFAFGWVTYSDAVKELNPYAAFLTSSNLKTWNFGSIEQKLSIDVWNRIFEHAAVLKGKYISQNLNILIASAIFALGFFLVKKKQAFILLGALYIVGPLVFTNLFYVHDYYHYANSVFLCAMAGLICLSFIESRRQWLSLLGKYTVFPLIILTFISGYFQFYFHIQNVPIPKHSKFLALTHFIKTNTHKDDVIVFKDFDWDSRYAFYSQRKMLMAKHLNLKGEQFNTFLHNLHEKDLHIGAIVFKNNDRLKVIADLKNVLGKDAENVMNYGNVLILN